MQFEEEELIELFAENYAIENGFDAILSENFIDEVKNEYEELRRRNPRVAGMVKALIYTASGPLGGLAYGIRQKQLMNRGKIDREQCVVLRKTLKGLGFPLLAGIISTPGVAVLGAIMGDGPEDKIKQNKKLKEDINIYYTEEELLEAVDILVENYGFYEDEAIDMVCEAYEMELLDEGKVARAIFGDYKGAKEKFIKTAINGNIIAMDPDSTEEEILAAHKAAKNAAVDFGKAGVRATAPVALTGAAGIAAYKAYKKNKSKKEAEARRRRSLRGRLSRR